MIESFVYYCRNCGRIEQADSGSMTTHRDCAPDPVTYCICGTGQRLEAEETGIPVPAAPVGDPESAYPLAEWMTPEAAARPPAEAGPCPLCQDSGRARQSAIRTALGDDGGDWRADAEADYQRSIAADLRAHGFRVLD
jgi:hypothetical protein